jgi:hypothetical protein
VVEYIRLALENAREVGGEGHQLDILTLWAQILGQHPDERFQSAAYGLALFVVEHGGADHGVRRLADDVIMNMARQGLRPQRWPEDLDSVVVEALETAEELLTRK